MNNYYLKLFHEHFPNQSVDRFAVLLEKQSFLKHGLLSMPQEQLILFFQASRVVGQMKITEFGKIEPPALCDGLEILTSKRGDMVKIPSNGKIKAYRVIAGLQCEGTEHTAKPILSDEKGDFHEKK